MINVQYFVNADKEGVYNGRKYKGIVTAVCDGKRAFSRAYLPDAFDEELGKAIANKRLRVKLLRQEEVELNECFDLLDRDIQILIKAQERVIDKINSRQLQQERLKDELLDMFEGMK